MLTRQVETTPLNRLLGCALQKLACGLAKELSYVHLLCLPSGDHPTLTSSEGLFVEESAEEVVEETAASQRGASEGHASAAPSLRRVHFAEVLDPRRLPGNHPP